MAKDDDEEEEEDFDDDHDNDDDDDYFQSWKRHTMTMMILRDILILCHNLEGTGQCLLQSLL